MPRPAVVAILAAVMLAGCGQHTRSSATTPAAATPNVATPARATPATPTAAAPTATVATTVASTTTPAATTLAPTTTTTATTTIPPTTTTTVPHVVATTTAPGVPLPTVPAGSVLEVGDSISLDAAPYLQASGVVVNGEVSRQFSTGIGIVAALAAAHQLPQTLVVDLGANGTVTAAEVDEMVQAATGVRHLVFVDVIVPRTWEADDNAVLLAAPARYPTLVTVADWHAVAGAHPEWFTADGVHLNPDGARALAGLILTAARS